MKQHYRMGLALLAVLLCCLGVFVFNDQSASALINPQINFQGKLTNPDGTNVTDGTYSIRFRIYSDPTLDAANTCVANTCKWEETQASVAVSSGIFQVSLGSSTALPGSVDFNTAALYLGVKVGSDAEMTPRIQLSAAPYAFNADEIDGLDSANIVQLAQGVQTDSSTTNASLAVNKTGATAQIANFQRGGTTVFSIGNDGAVLVKSQTNSASALQVQSSTAVSILSADTSSNEVAIGSNTTDTTQVLLQLDSFNTFADTATCGTTTNQGGIYYNTQSNAVRACLNGAWEDLVSTAGLGLQLFGVVPDSGTNPGDIYGATGVQNGPCKVSIGSTTATVSWTGCTAYSGGRKVIVAAGTAATTNAGAGNFQHLCLTGTSGQPVLSTAGAENANLATVSFPSVTAPIVCLADVKFAAANNTITDVYDTRTYTTTDKITVALNSAIGLGTIVVYSATKGVVASTTTANTNSIAGVVVAATGAAQTTSINAIIATGGPAAVKAVTGTNTVGVFLFTSLTAGYAQGATVKPAEGTGTIYNVLGNARTAWSGASACTANADTCQGSFVIDIDKR